MKSLDQFRNIFKKNQPDIQLKIFVDKIKTCSKKSFNITTKKILTIKKLCEKISEKEKISVDELVLMVGGKFWDEDCTLGEVVKGLKMDGGAYIVRAVVINLDDQETIDYDVEAFLREKYSAPLTLECDYVITDELDLETKDIEETEIVCQRCSQTKTKESMHYLDYCRHAFCKDCFVSWLSKSIGALVKCPQEDCGRLLFDHEIQKILGTDAYRQWECIINKRRLTEDGFKIPRSGWICDSCTFLNIPLVTCCKACSGTIPRDYIVPSFYEPTDEEKVRKKEEEVERENQEEQKRIHRELLKNLAKQSVAVTFERTECPVCMVLFEAGQAIMLQSCLHTICRDCLHNYLVNIEDPHVQCPTENCIGLVEDREMQEILTKAEYDRYQELSLRMAEAKEKHSFHCKEMNCQGWIVHDGFLERFRCPICKKENCIKCEAIHEPSSCEQYQLEKANDPQDAIQNKNDEYIQSMIDSGNAMKCPGCKMIVEKNRGCDGVLCRNCGMMICWATKGPRWGPKGKGDSSGGCGCRFFWGKRCHKSCRYCH